ncbi:hypothetical protein SAMN05192558_12523 [Actinokineospora alba]|uniref:Bifunctional DNA primase/polymerase, N-terminal n=1 Tax=Actinokineospora alba TaxID=504798 RepID=A0A1H0WMW7_9PSEU|nr:hypothetical protein [Actinokineospora alba]TDP67173.1 hypothetical protein C8E96_2698 [Actinokineospora alba]SDJ53820.1 hypothetical protein SAMN05421871_11923 [Actinokineospora alba]SDP92054.1 hypothetical protein SAMN05192558_12523 [Actinokineospora alba]
MRTEPCVLNQTATWYRDAMAWPVEVTDGLVILPLGQGTVAFDVPGNRAAPVRKRLEQDGFCTPAVLLMSAQRCHVMFLAEADHAVLGQYQMPEHVRYLCAPAVLPLPILRSPMSQHHWWFSEPDPARRWLHSAAAVLAAINAETPPQQRSHMDTRRRPPVRI